MFVTVTLTCAAFRSGSRLIAGDCASMTTLAVFGQCSASQSTAHMVPACRASLMFAIWTMAEPSAYRSAAPMVSTLLSGGMSMPKLTVPPSGTSSTAAACHRSGLMAYAVAVSSHMPSASRRNESSDRLLRMRMIACSLVRFG